LLISRSITRGIVAIIITLACGLYGIVNMIGFAVTNRLIVAEATSVANSTEWKKYEEVREAIKERIAWAEKAIVEERSPREKSRIREYRDKRTEELNALEPPMPAAAVILADPQTTWFSKLFHIDAEIWQLALPVPIGILLFTAEVLSFVFAMHLLTAALDAFQRSGAK